MNPENENPPNARDLATVRRAFGALCRHYGHAASDHAAEWDFLVRSYGEPHRAYHNMTHIAGLIRLFDKMAVSDAERAGLYAFAIYHDVVYDTRDPDIYLHNEIRSANLGRNFLFRLRAPRRHAETLNTRIRATQTHDLDIRADFVGAAAMDADMGILAAPPARYARYVAGIRREFAHIRDAVFYPARAEKFLRPTLAKPHIFMTPAWRRMEAAARENMAAELAATENLIKTKGYAPRPRA